MRGRGGWGWGLCVVGFVIGCGGSVRNEGGDTSAQGGAGQAGAPTAGSAQFGGSSETGGIPNSPEPETAGANDAGAGGETHESEPGCVELSGVSVTVDVTAKTYPVCATGSQTLPIAFIGRSTHDFTCCAVSDTSPKYSLLLAGQSPTVASSLAKFSFRLPTGAPLGVQNLDVTCSGGPLEHPIAIEVLAAPMVTGVSSEIRPTDTVTLEGQHLDGVSVTAVPSTGDGATHDCVPVSADDSAIACKFSDIGPGEYRLHVQNAACPVDVPPPLVVLEPE